jgi:hypothetical protein
MYKIQSDDMVQKSHAKLHIGGTVLHGEAQGM